MESCWQRLNLAMAVCIAWCKAFMSSRYLTDSLWRMSMTAHSWTYLYHYLLHCWQQYTTTCAFCSSVPPPPHFSYIGPEAPAPPTFRIPDLKRPPPPGLHMRKTEIEQVARAKVAIFLLSKVKHPSKND